MINHLIKSIKEHRNFKHCFVNDGYYLYLMIYNYKNNRLSISFHIQYPGKNIINLIINNANYSIYIYIGINNGYYYIISNLDRYLSKLDIDLD